MVPARRIGVRETDIETAVTPELVSQILQSLVAKTEVQGERRSQLDII